MFPSNWPEGNPWYPTQTPATPAGWRRATVAEFIAANRPAVERAAQAVLLGMLPRLMHGLAGHVSGAEFHPVSPAVASSMASNLRWLVTSLAAEQGITLE